MPTRRSNISVHTLIPRFLILFLFALATKTSHAWEEAQQKYTSVGSTLINSVYCCFKKLWHSAVECLETRGRWRKYIFFFFSWVHQSCWREKRFEICNGTECYLITLPLTGMLHFKSSSPGGKFLTEECHQSIGRFGGRAFYVFFCWLFFS